MKSRGTHSRCHDKLCNIKHLEKSWLLFGVSKYLQNVTGKCCLLSHFVFLSILCTLWRQSHDSRQQTELQRNNRLWHSAWFFSLPLNFHSPVLHFPEARGNLPKGHNLNWSTTGSLIPFHVAELKVLDIMFFFTLKVLFSSACKRTRGKERVPFPYGSLASPLVDLRPFTKPPWSRIFFPLVTLIFFF